MKYTPMQLVRLANGLTQRQTADLLGISQGHLSQVETYVVNASHELLVKMTQLYNCHMSDLFPSSS